MSAPECRSPAATDVSAWWQDHSPAIAKPSESETARESAPASDWFVATPSPQAPEPALLAGASTEPRRTALLWGAAIAAAVLVLASGLIVAAVTTGGEEKGSGEAETAALSPLPVGEPADEPANRPSPLPGVAKTTQSRPLTVARTQPAPGEQVGWARAAKAELIGSAKVAQTKPAAAARTMPAAGERVGWAKGTPVATAPTQTEAELRAQLASAPDVSLARSAQAVLKSWTSNIKSNLQLNGDGQVTNNMPVLSVRPDLANLPFRGGTSSKLNGRAAVNLAQLSRKLNAYIDGLAPRNMEGKRVAPNNLEALLKEERRGNRLEWVRVEAVPALQQILNHEDKPLRRMLVDLLTDIPEPPATAALVRRALFDLDPEIRSAARNALKDRNPEEYRSVLLGALRYPWAPAAWHAAEALVSLNRREVVPNLVTVLDRPDPAGVQQMKNKYVVQDLVKVLHTRNCLLCHAPSALGNDICMKMDPWVKRRTVLTVKQASALIASGQLSPNALQGYAGSGGGGGGWRGGAAGAGGGANAYVTAQTDLMIRFDITFLRQDFSIQLPTAAPGINQRFDYIVRTRVLPREQAERRLARTTPPETYPQRDAVLFALTRLTGKDAGISTLAWNKLYPDAEVEVETQKLLRRLLQAGHLERPNVLKSYSEGKGEAYTRALIAGVAQLAGSPRAQTREALARRLAELDIVTLRGRLGDKQAGVRQAAVIACERKKDRALVGDLIARLEDTDADTARLARSALKVLTGQDLDGAAAWQEWWKASPATR